MRSGNNSVDGMFVVLVTVCCTIWQVEARAMERQKRVIEGEAYAKGEYPFHVTFWHKMNVSCADSAPGVNHVCGGVLVDTHWVLSNAVCFDDAMIPGLSNLTNWIARLGVHAQTEADEEAQDCEVEDLIISPDYNLTEGYGQLALVKLNCEVNLTKSVSLAKLNTDDNCPRDNQSLTIIGWGQTQLDDWGLFSNIPHKATVKLVSEEDCTRRFAQEDIARRKPYLRFGDGNLCAGVPSGDVDACFGDTGSPLLARCDDYDGGDVDDDKDGDNDGDDDAKEGNDSKAPVVVGLMGYGKCAWDVIPTPSVFTRISNYIDWIENTIRNN